MNSLFATSLIVLTLSGGYAMAQETTTSTQSTTTTAPPQGDYSASKTEHSIDGAGNETERQKTVESNGDGVARSSTEKMKSPDGSESVKHQETTSNADGSTSSETSEHSSNPQN